MRKISIEICELRIGDFGIEFQIPEVSLRLCVLSESHSQHDERA